MTHLTRVVDERDVVWSTNGPRAKAAATISSAPMAFGPREVDRHLLDAFLVQRDRSRGPLVAVNERMMITNVGASELLQASDHRALWEHVTRSAGRPAGATKSLVLNNGVVVSVRSQPVGDHLAPVGAVLHLCLPSPGAATAVQEGTPEAPRAAPARSLDCSLMTGWTDLTDSERTVAELVARGMTNKQAGRRMFVSRHTVDYHLRRVFTKLGVSSRVELARVVGEHYDALNG